MPDLTLDILGCGDAFCSGGRFQTSYHLCTREQGLLMDCGATTLLAMQRRGIDPSDIDHILLSHLHGDHFGGVPFFLMQAEFALKRTKPLTVIGPKGTFERLKAALDILFPGISDTAWSFPFTVVELEAGRTRSIGDLSITPHLVDHPSGAPSLAFRLESGGKTLAFSGDTRWTDALIDIADGADLLIVECHAYRPNGLPHLDWQTLNRHVGRLRARRILLTHMGDSMLDRLPMPEPGPFEFAEDGWTTTI